MQIRVLTVRFDPARGEFDDAELRQFQQAHTVTAVREHFFTDGQRPGLALVVEFTPATAIIPVIVPNSPPPAISAAATPSPSAVTKARPTYPTAEELRATLATDVQRQVFDALRRWRRGKATDEAIPPYAVLTNQQVLDLAAQMPRTKAGVLKVAGIGKKKADRYATAILAEVAAINGTGDHIGDDATRAPLATVTHESDAADDAELVGTAAVAVMAAEPAEMPA